MKPFCITVTLKRTYAERFGLETEVVEDWLESKLDHLTSLFEGDGRVNVRKVDDLRFDVALAFIVNAKSKIEAIERFRECFAMLEPLASGLEVREAARFKLCTTRIGGEILEPFFVRVNPETGQYRDSED